MRAALLEEQGKPLCIRDDIEIAELRPGHVRVRISHCGVCHSDLSVVDGAFPSPLPVVLGHEAAGIVDAVGPGVESLAPGDPVVLAICAPCGRCYWCARGEATLCVNGLGIQTSTFPDGTTGLSRNGKVVYRGLNLAAFAEHVVTQETGAVKISAEVPLDVACVVGCAVQTGVGAVLNAARVEEGATVLVMGLGGVGLSVVQGARLAGASRIIVSDPVADRREAARRFGATDLVDPAHEDVTARARELTEVGVDYAFDAAGHVDLIRTGFEATRSGGTTVSVGAPSLQDAITFAPAPLLLAQEKKLVGTLLGSCNSVRDVPRLLSLWQAGRLDLEGLITARRPLSEINQAMEDLRESRGIRTVISI